jgi:diguanylate cyclase (GGDEF)-like protein
VLNYCSKLPRNVNILLTVLSLIALVTLDYFSGYQVAFSVFYLIPVSIVAYVFGRTQGLLISLFCAVVWQYTNYISGETFSTPWHGLWNITTRFGFYAFTTVVLCDLHSALRKEEQLSQTDSLTGALTRRAFYNQLHMEMVRSKRYGRPITLVYFDLDNFKSVNDTQGHLVGDKILKVVVSTLKNATRELDAIARFGGDEFAILMPETDQAGARVIVPRLHQTLLKEMHGINKDVNMSIGVLTCNNFSDFDDILQEADKLMYAAKNSGKSTIVYGSYEKKVIAA